MAIRDLLREVNYDDALTLVRGQPLHALVDAANQTDRLRQACMVSDALDYGGDYDSARQEIERAGRSAMRLDQPDISINHVVDREHVKQECWALMVWGMSLYRNAGREHHGYTEAMRRFELAQKILLMLRLAGVKCTGSLARSWYCIGLVHRQHKDYRRARAAFASCVELTSDGLRARAVSSQSTASYDYNLARCYGLGIGFIAYDEALLSEARAALVMANRLLLGKKVRFIRAYVDVVHAAALMSGSLSLPTIDDGLRRLQLAYNTLTADGAHGHAAYAARAANEIAQAWLRRARALPAGEKDAALVTAEAYVKKALSPGVPGISPESRTSANSLIISSRVLRERGAYSEALDAAYQAKNVGGSQTFSLIDCQITVGEAAYALGRYSDATDAFLQALALGKGSRKITAVCHLHLSRALLAQGKLSQATGHFSQWELLQPELDNAFLTDLGNKVAQQLMPVKEDFRIPHAAPDLNAKTHEHRLHGWLARNALLRADWDYKQAGRLLGDKNKPYNAATVRLWEEQGGPGDSKAQGA